MKYAWLISMAVISTVQFGGFFVLDRYLTASSGAAASANVVSQKTIQPPEDLLYDIDAQGTRIAVYNKQQQVVVKNQNDDVVSIVPLPGIHYLHWMDNGSSLFYARQIDGKTEFGIFNTNENKIIPLHDIHSTDVKMQNVYKSAYSQSIFTVYRQNNLLYAASYEAIFGWKAAPLTGIQPKQITFNEKENVLFIQDQQENLFRFTNGKIDRAKEKRAGQPL